jgi:hypothetical protein
MARAKLTLKGYGRPLGRRPGKGFCLVGAAGDYALIHLMRMVTCAKTKIEYNYIKEYKNVFFSSSFTVRT